VPTIGRNKKIFDRVPKIKVEFQKFVQKLTKDYPKIEINPH
jgi:hypothetical protein